MLNPQLLPLQRVCCLCSACAPRNTPSYHTPSPPQVRSSLLLEVRLLRDTLRDAQVCHP